MLKQLTATFIILSIAWHILSEAAVYLSFKINQDYIEKYLCVNREDPESDCHGCCQLKKQLDEQQKQKQEAPDSNLKKVEIQYFPISGWEVRNFPISIWNRKNDCDIAVYSIGKNDIFHPPKFRFFLLTLI
ncbi:hypothetical protein [Mangrovibacterium sp.]|uniref:hypothetical protein n=1 Tax=Mangrovibacterium sp. TaxID=1961364 RepID=UPI0035626E5E